MINHQTKDILHPFFSSIARVWSLQSFNLCNCACRTVFCQFYREKAIFLIPVNNIFTFPSKLVSAGCLKNIYQVTNKVLSFNVLNIKLVIICEKYCIRTSDYPVKPVAVTVKINAKRRISHIAITMLKSCKK